MGFLKKKHEIVAEPVETDNVLDFRTGKSGGGPYNNKDWLTPMKIGTKFLARAFEHKGPSLFLYIVADKTEKGVCVLVPDQGAIWLDPKRFCGVTELYETLKVEEKNE